MPAFLVCCPPWARRPTGRTGVRDSGRWRPVQDSNLHPLPERQPSYRWTNGPWMSPSKRCGFEPQGLTNPPRYSKPGTGHSSTTPGRWPCRSDSNGRPLTSDATPSCAKLRRDDTRGQIQTDERVFARRVLSNAPTESGTAPRAPPLCVGPESAGQELNLCPFVGDLFSCQGAIWATRTKTFMQMNSQWRRESNRVFGRFGGRPASGAPSLRVLSCVRRTPRKSKSRSLAEAARAAMDP